MTIPTALLIHLWIWLFPWQLASESLSHRGSFQTGLLQLFNAENSYRIFFLGFRKCVWMLLEMYSNLQASNPRWFTCLCDSDLLCSIQTDLLIYSNDSLIWPAPFEWIFHESDSTLCCRFMVACSQWEQPCFSFSPNNSEADNSSRIYIQRRRSWIALHDALVCVVPCSSSVAVVIETL